LTARPARATFTAVSIPSARETFRKFLAQKGLRVTSQRLAIFDAAFARKEHFTAEQLLDYAGRSTTPCPAPPSTGRFPS
jgi:hypothetical protein